MRGVVTLGASSLVVFVAIHLVPGGFVQLYVPIDAPEAVRVQLTHQYGLDQPLPVQYLKWLLAIFRGDLGESLLTHRPVAQEILARLPTTIELAVLATALATGFGVAIGTAMAVTRRSVFQGSATRLLGNFLLSAPDFVVASFLVIVFSGHPLIFDVGEYTPLSESLLGNIKSVALPAFALSLFSAGLVARTTRDAVLRVMGERYILAAVARGDTPGSIIARHVYRNASLPVITVVAVNIGYLMSGAVVIERAFSLPGVGQYLVNAIHARDYAVIQGVTLIAAVSFVVVNSLADFIYRLVDPRLRVAINRGH